MNAKQLQEIRERVEKATPGPWEAAEGNINWWYVENGPYPFVNLTPWSETYNVDGPQAKAIRQNRQNNAQFIAQARDDVPALVEEVERLQAALEIVEWGGESGLCPVCRNFVAEGHTEKCPIGKALGR